jgi:predicted transcriptional regulator
MSRLILEVTRMISVPKISVKKIARRAISISPETSLQEAAKILVNNGVQEALVEDKYPGLISMTDITRTVAEGRTGLEVCEIMTRGFPTINSEELIYEAIKMLGKMGASQLVVLEKGMLWGIVKSGDLIKTLVAS